MFEKIMVTVAGKPVSVLIETPSQMGTNPSSRPPCFVVGLSSHYHDKFSENFRAFYQLVLVDLYWTGDQFPPGQTEKLTMGELSDHIEQVREQLEQQLGERYQKIFMVAHSAYGFISTDYALKHPDKLLGVINISSPLIFNDELLLKWQEEYVDSNFGSPQAGGPIDRFHAYYKQKKAFAEEKAEHSKHYFVQWYTSMGPLLWKNPVLWQNKDGQAEKIWEPWKIPVFDRKTGTTRLEIRDVNMPMLFKYIELVTNMDCYDKIHQVKTPILWVIPLGDSRVSLYQLEDKRAKSVPKNVEFFHPADGGHWPMYPGDNNTAEFDNKTIGWGNEVIRSLDQNRPPLISKL